MISPKKMALTGINAHDKAESLHFSNKARRELKSLVKYKFYIELVYKPISHFLFGT